MSYDIALSALGRQPPLYRDRYEKVHRSQVASCLFAGAKELFKRINSHLPR